MIDSILNWWYTQVLPAGYTSVELLMFMSGFALWIAAYYLVIKNIIRYKYNEMPMLAGTGNISWEFIWAFLFKGDLGLPFQLGCMAWFALDIVINYATFKYARNQVQNPFFRKNFNYFYILAIISWFLIIYTQGKEGNDNQLGVISALITNVVMSALFIYQLITESEHRGKGMSYAVAWFRMLGTAIITVASSYHWPDNTWLMSLGLVTFMLDITYIWLYKNFQPEKQTIAK